MLLNKNFYCNNILMSLVTTDGGVVDKDTVTKGLTSYSPKLS